MNDIASRIIKEAEAEASIILKENSELLDTMKREVVVKEEERKKNEEEELKEVYLREVKHHISRGNIEAGKEVLRAKTRLIEETLDELKKRIREDSELYRNFMMEVMLRGIQTGKEEVIVSEQDRSLVDEAFMAELNRRGEQKLKKKSTLSIADDNRETGGGFFLREGKREFNAAVDTVAETIAEEFQLNIIAIFFKEEACDD